MTFKQTSVALKKIQKNINTNFCHFVHLRASVAKHMSSIWPQKSKMDNSSEGNTSHVEQ